MQVIELSKNLDLVAAPALLENLMRYKGQDILVDARQVQRMGAQCFQILLSAKKTWETERYDLNLANASADFVEAVALMGGNVEDLTYLKQDSEKED